MFERTEQGVLGMCVARQVSFEVLPDAVAGSEDQEGVVEFEDSCGKDSDEAQKTTIMPLECVCVCVCERRKKSY